MITNTKRAFKVGLLTFSISLIISLFLQFSLAPWISVFLLFLIILIGILFDIVGTAVTAANEAPFHAMGADKIRGSKQAVILIRHTDKVANFCNDVVGDISGTISGAIVAGIILEFSQRKTFISSDIMNAAAIALVAAFNVGGKAFGKSFAIERANHIVFTVGKLISFFKFINLNPKRSKRKHRINTRKVRKN